MKSRAFILFLFLAVASALSHAHLLFSSASSGTPSDVTSGLVAQWKMDEGTGSTTADNIGGFNGTFTGSPTWITGAGGNGALSFSGSGQYVSTSLTSLASLSSGTISWWMKPSTAFNSGAIRGLWGHFNTPKELTAQVYSDNNFYIGWNVSGTDARIAVAASSGNYVSGAWHFYCFTWDATGSKLYMDGSASPFGSNATAPNVSNVGANFLIGAHVTATPFPGSLDDFRIFNRVLSTTEMATLYTLLPK